MAPWLAAAQQMISYSMLPVVESVTVEDGNGHWVDNLSADDFSLAEDGVPQRINLCVYQNLGSPVPLFRRDVPPGQISVAPSPDVERYRNRRLLVLYFDFAGMSAGDRTKAIAAAKEFIAGKLEPADLVALICWREGDVRVLEDFTDDRSLLQDDIQKVDGPDPGYQVGIADSAAAFVDDESVIPPADRQLAALRVVARVLGALPDRKAVIWFTSGSQFGAANRAQLQATINAAVLAKVAVFPIAVGAFAGDTLDSLASKTGGKASGDSPELASALVVAQQSISNRYLIFYWSRYKNPDGVARQVRIKLSAKSDARLSYRQSFFAPRSYGRFNLEDSLAQALSTGDPIVDMPIALEESSIVLATGEYSVHITARIPATELILAYKKGDEHTAIELAGEVTDHAGRKVAGLRDQLIPIRTGTGELNRKQLVEYRTTFTLAPGDYSVKLAAIQAYSGRVGTYWLDFSVSGR